VTPTVTAVTITAAPAAITVGSTAVLQAQVTDNRGRKLKRLVTWELTGTMLERTDTSSAGTVEVRALRAGSAIIRATSENISSDSLTIQLRHRVPTISSVSPQIVEVRQPDLVLRVTGIAFVDASRVLWNGVPAQTTYVSSTTLDAVIPAGSVAPAGTHSVAVLTPAPGGGTSSAFSVEARNPLPAVTSISHETVPAGGEPFMLTVSGHRFVETSRVRWRGEDRPTSYRDSNTLEAVITASDIATGGTFEVSVVNDAPGGGTSNAAAVVVANPQPAIASVSYPTVTAGAIAFSITVTGNGFVPGSEVRWNGTKRVTTYRNSTTLEAGILAADVATAGRYELSVLNGAPGGGAADAVYVTVSNPAPTIGGVSPSSLNAGDPEFVLTVTGTGFAPTSEVHWDGTKQRTTFHNSTTLEAVIPASAIAAAGTGTVGVVSPGPGGGQSSTVSVSVNNAAPVLTGASATNVTAGGPAFVLTVTGSGFVPASVVRWNAVDRSTTYRSSTTLEAAIPATDLVTAGAYPVSVVSPTPGGGASNAVTVTVTNPAPAIASISPAKIAAGTRPLVLTIIGNGFVAGSVVQWNGQSRSTNHLSSTTLEATLLAEDIANPGSGTISVFSPPPGGGVSNASTVAVSDVTPAITSIFPPNATAGDSTFIATITGRNFVAGSSVRWNGQDRLTTYRSSDTLEAQIRASDVAAAGPADIAVINPSGGGSSNTISFAVNNPTPVIGTLSPNRYWDDDDIISITLLVRGSGFVPVSVVRWNGSSLATTYRNATTLEAIIPESEVAKVGEHQVSVLNPPPVGGVSSALPFPIGNEPWGIEIFDATEVTATSALLRGSADGYGLPIRARFGYREGADGPESYTEWSAAAPGKFEISMRLTGLKPSTSYEFWLEGTNAFGSSDTLPVLRFTTLSVSAPDVSPLDARH
jgi:hypothetical protein